MELYHKVIQADVCRPAIDCKLFCPSFGDINLIHNKFILFGSGFSLRVGVSLLGLGFLFFMLVIWLLSDLELSITLFFVYILYRFFSS